MCFILLTSTDFRKFGSPLCRIHRTNPDSFAKSPEGHLFVRGDWTWDLGLDPFYYIFNTMCAVAKIPISF